MSRGGLREAREGAGLTQAELAARAGVSRQLVGAVEVGRHLPRVDAALALAAVLGVDVESLFAAPGLPADIVSGEPSPDRAPLRLGRVGDRLVSAPARVGSDGFDVADGLVEGVSLVTFGRHGPGLVVAGCEPGLDLLERLLREGGMGAVAATTSSARALGALVAGRVHAAVVHGPVGRFPAAPAGVEIVRFHLARWQVGLSAPGDGHPRWWEEALSGRVAVVQREEGAVAQLAFTSAVGGERVAGPRVGSHLEAARRSVIAGMPAVTIEPAALAVGAAFHPLEVHEAELWCAAGWAGDRSIVEAVTVLGGVRFRRRLEAVGGYDLSSCGMRAA